MKKHLGKQPRILWFLVLVCSVWVTSAALTAPAQAQTICNSQLIIGFPNNDNVNRVIGQTVRMSLTLTNGPSQDAGSPDNQTFDLIDFFPSCTSVTGGVCTPDPGAVAGAPPPIQFIGNVTTANCPAVPVANASDPFDIKFALTPAFNFINGAGCTFSFDVMVVERGSDGTPANIAQLANSNGICSSTLTSSASGTAAITLTCGPCNDGNACNGTETCDAATAQCVPGTPLNCNDNNACTADSCAPATGCVNTPEPPSFCDDNNACTTDSCAPATGCVHTTQPPSFCDDNNACTADSCAPATGCVHTTQPPSFCDDNNACTADSCAPATGCVHTTQPPSFCDDNNACTDDSCSPATGCVNTPKPPSFCDDNDVCTQDTCNPQSGCVHVPAEPPPAACTNTICRTPGFWGTHAGTEKGNGKGSVNITEAVIDCVDGNCADHTASDFLSICGEKIDSPDTNPADGTTDVNDAASSTEALCVPVKGDSILQLARQLTAAALNCVISGGGADCAGTPLYSTVFSDCNSKCASGVASKDEMTACIGQLDCLNNGGTFDNGICSAGGSGNCHDRLLVNDTLGLNFEPPGAAGSSNACNAAHDTACTVVGPGENQCSTDSLP
jgi:hypothetical protein